jgi:hypothetical protein
MHNESGMDTRFMPLPTKDHGEGLLKKELSKALIKQDIERAPTAVGKKKKCIC